MARPKQLSKDTIEEIRSLYCHTDCTQHDLSKSFGVSQSTICKIVNNYIHKNITNVVMGGEADVRIGYKHGD
jgi:DNA-binding transcriptional regulator LsrR (DeoR family)